MRFYALSVGLLVATRPSLPWLGSMSCFYALSVGLLVATIGRLIGTIGQLAFLCPVSRAARSDQRNIQ